MSDKENLSGQNDDLQIAIAYLDLLLSKQAVPPLPEALEKNDSFYLLVRKITELRTILAEFSTGNVTSPVTMRGYIGGSLKALQSNLRHMAWQMQRIGTGDFSQRVEFMGEFACSFNMMLATFEEAYGEVKRREQKMTELAESLCKEIDHRVEIEEMLRESEEKYRHLATVDFLTGVCNRRHFFTLADREMERAWRSGNGFCLAMLDVDRFKDINDRYGHLNGDTVLSAIAEAIVANLRTIDIVARYGGEEFVIILPETPAEGGYATLERLRGFIASMPITLGASSLNVTVSIGMTFLRALSPQEKRREFLEKAIDRADQALYRAKENGRNLLEKDLEPVTAPSEM